MPERWITVTESDYAWEREALRHLRAGIPDRDPYRAWANFEFLLDGTIGEVDALVIAPKGMFLIEIKSWPGRLQGDSNTWRLTKPDGNVRSFDSPLLVTNRKAKRLKSLLMRQKAVRGSRIPFITPLIFLSNNQLECRLDPTGRAGVHGLDGESDQSGGLTSIVEAVQNFTPEEHARLAGRKVDRATSEKLARGLEQAGVRPSQQRRQVGELVLGDLIAEGPGYQDFDAQLPRFERTHRRVRIYGAASTSSQEDREHLARAAEREFELLDAVNHPGIIKVLSWHDHELGPALVFDRDVDEQRLDHFLQERAGELDIGARLELIRELAEAVAHAHSRRLFHRALSPQSTLAIRPGTAEQRFSILNWQTGLRDSGTAFSATISGTRDVEQLLDVESSAYLAPEAISQPDADPELLDVFSLGAIAFHVFSGRPAAASLSALVAALQREGCLEVSSVLDGAGPNLIELIRLSTSADASKRLASVSEFLELLDYLEDEITAPEHPDEPNDAEVKLGDVKKGSVLAGYEVERRLGRGSTAVAFLVTDEEGARRVLKVANDPDRNDRLRDEGEVLAKLKDPTIIGIHGGVLDVAGSAAIVLTYASEGTLASRLQREGRLGLETLERWGGDLLSAVSYLERQGIAHRDIKPENLGIIERGRNHHRHLVLMDFSLSRAPVDQVGAGTQPYIDPFLGTRERPRWDVAAERYAATVVLYEMATGTTPSWGGRDPRMITDEVVIERDALPREVAGSLATLLARGLARDASARFDTADDMLAAWRRVFSELDAPSVDSGESADPEALRAGATMDTPLVAVGLSARALSALDGLGNLHTVEDFLAYPQFRLNHIGVGTDTREELRQAYRELQARLTTQDARPPRVQPSGDPQTLHKLTSELVPAERDGNASEVRALRLLLTLEAPPDDQTWPSQTDVASVMDLTPGRVGQIVPKARHRWASVKGLEEVRDQLCVLIGELAGVVTADELVAAVASSHGLTGPEALTISRAAVRAAVEVELADSQPRLVQRRRGSRVILAALGDGATDGEAALNWAVRLGERASDLAASDPLPGPADVVSGLRALKVPEALGQIGQERLVQLAAAVSDDAAASARLELYPRDMDARRALLLGRNALLGLASHERLSIGEIRNRIASRFPQAEQLPERPTLDQLLSEAALDLEWDEAENGYFFSKRDALTGGTSYESSINRLPTSHATTLPPRLEPDVAEARAFEERLQAVTTDGGLVTLMAAPAEVAQAVDELRRLASQTFDIDAVILRQLHAAAADRNVRWDLVVQADAADRATQDWQRLSTLVQMAIPGVQHELMAGHGTVLLHNLGLLARYGQLGLVDALREGTSSKTGPSGFVLVVPADDQRERPAIDGQAIPVLTANEWARIPRSWLRNLHRAKRDRRGAA